MRRASALGVLAGGLGAVAGCSDQVCWSLPATSGSPATPTAFGFEIYEQDDVSRAMSLLTGCGGATIRVGLVRNQFAFSDAVIEAAALAGARAILVTPYATQPVPVAAYAANCASFAQRYGKYNPAWEIWNEPNLAFYWGATPNVMNYTQLAIETARALRGAGAIDVWSGGTSGIDFEWTRTMAQLGAFEYMNGCAVHTYEEPCTQYGQYVELRRLLPENISIHTTETCVPSTQDQDFFLEQMWYLHRGLGLPTLVWCELRDGTAGHSGAYTLPYGLVYVNYVPKPVYWVAERLTASSPRPSSPHAKGSADARTNSGIGLRNPVIVDPLRFE